ncbi:ribbon-helix-helix protein, CopG family [Acidicapsa dinghuensis]|uniref:Ribbon-helix-helix protein, CopG family n=1 Tax=Acidicapsa dinghuensis TaxID=2218256 RepID=A0ABW1EK94_9BACT|nr:ribbon-helix-helix domain-containing protein [Acidicapsa dinghuensis]
MRTTKAISITLPSALLESAQSLAKRENRTMSELVREALRKYEELQERKRYWDELNAFGRASAEKIGVHSEEDVVRIVRESRRERR